jgi:hypothetical protein
MGGVATDNHKLAIVYGTVVGFIMISVIAIVANVIDNGLHRTLVSDSDSSASSLLLTVFSAADVD